MRSINNLTFISHKKNYNIAELMIVKCVKISFKINILQRLKDNYKKLIITNYINF